MITLNLQVRGIAEMCSPCPAVVSPRKRYLSEMMADSDLESRDEEFSIDEVRSKLHGQLEIQAVTGVPSPPLLLLLVLLLQACHRLPSPPG